jgi:hypothetical protein
MRCWKHPSEPAVAACVNCGRGLCRGCVPNDPPLMATCSDECAAAAGRLRSAIEMTGRKSLRSNRTSAMFCWMNGGVFAVIGTAMVATGATGPGLLFLLPAAAFGIGGYLYYRTSRSDV